MYVHVLLSLWSLSIIMPVHSQGLRDLTNPELTSVVEWGVKEMHFQQNDVCWKKESYGNGFGVAMTCASKFSQEGLLCYSKCQDGYSTSPANPLCYKKCPSGFRDDGLFCFKPPPTSSAGRSPAIGVSCAPGLVQEGLLCYSRCPSGYATSPANPLCYKTCPKGFRDDGLFCAKPAAYGRGVGHGCSWNFWGARCNPCPSGEEQWGLFCYPKCRANFHNVGCCICSPNCPKGFHDIGVSCTKPNAKRTIRPMDYCPPGYHQAGPLCFPNKFCRDDEFQSGLLCYPKCKPGYHNVGALICSPDCPTGFTDIGVSCAKPSHPRTIAPLSTCPTGTVKDPTGLLCYPPCRDNMRMVGPVCWQQCYANSGQPHDCGALCTKDAGTCVTSVLDMVLSPVTMAANLLTFGAAGAVKKTADVLVEGSTKLSPRVIDQIRAASTGGTIADQALFAIAEIETLRDALESSSEAVLGPQLRAAYGNVNAQQAIRQIANTVTLMIVKHSIADLVVNIVGLLDPTGIIGTIAAFAHPTCRARSNPPAVSVTIGGTETGSFTSPPATPTTGPATAAPATEAPAAATVAPNSNSNSTNPNPSDVDVWCGCVTNTSSHHSYKLISSPSGVVGVSSFTFTVQASNDAHIALSSNSAFPSGPNVLYEIVIGGWNNQASVLRRERQGGFLKIDGAAHDGNRVGGSWLSGHEPRAFWITFVYSNDTSLYIAVGHGNVVAKHGTQFMGYRDQNPINIRYIGVATGWNANGVWNTPCPQQLSPTPTPTPAPTDLPVCPDFTFLCRCDTILGNGTGYICAMTDSECNRPCPGAHLNDTAVLTQDPAIVEPTSLVPTEPPTATATAPPPTEAPTEEAPTEPEPEAPFECGYDQCLSPDVIARCQVDTCQPAPFSCNYTCTEQSPTVLQVNYTMFLCQGPPSRVVAVIWDLFHVLNVTDALMIRESEVVENAGPWSTDPTNACFPNRSWKVTMYIQGNNDTRQNEVLLKFLSGVRFANVTAATTTTVGAGLDVHVDVVTPPQAELVNPDLARYFISAEAPVIASIQMNHDLTQTCRDGSTIPASSICPAYPTLMTGSATSSSSSSQNSPPPSAAVVSIVVPIVLGVAMIVSVAGGLMYRIRMLASRKTHAHMTITATPAADADRDVAWSMNPAVAATATGQLSTV